MRVSDTTIRRALLVVAAIAMLWALVLRITGGIAIETSWRLISSRNALRPLIAGLLLVACYVAVWRRNWRVDLGPLVALARPRVVGGTAVAAALIAGLGWASRIAAGPDPSGYVSQAAMFARGKLTVEAPRWAQNAGWDDAAYTASPVGWHPTRQTHIIAPTYSPGLPLIMAGVTKVAGGDAVFYIVPILGAVLVWSAYLLGTHVGGPWTGAVAAVLVVSSPTFLSMQLQVMSDVPVAAFWTVSFVAALRGRPWLAGTAAALAVLTRPNVVPLVLVPFALIVTSDRRLRHVLAFGAPIGVACVVVAALNWRYHGSPLLSGYGPLNRLYSLANVWPNLLQYGRWFIELHTPLPLIGLAAFLVAKADRWRITIVTFVIPFALLALYTPFLVFQWWEWSYTRFLLPAYPALFTGLGIMGAVALARWRRPAMTTAAVALVAIVSVRGWMLTINSGVFTQQSGDARYARAVDYAKRLPDRSILLSNAHSGTLRFYTGRDILRFEAIRPEELDKATAQLQHQGYALFLIGDEFEIDHFRNLFAGTRTAAALPKKPRAELGGVLVYDLKP